MQALPYRHVLLFLLSATGLAGCPAGGVIDDVADDDDTMAQPCEESMQIGLDTSAIDLFFWQGEPPPEETRPLATTVPPCGELVVVAQPEWLSASVSTEDDSVTVAVVPEELVSGHLSGYVTLLDSDEPDTPWTIEVALDAFVSPESPTSWNVLVVGVDGLDGEVAMEPEVPNLELLLRGGLWTMAASTHLSAPTVSGPGWTSLLTGVEATRHNVWGNGGYDDRDELYPSFLWRVKHEAGLDTAVSIQWNDIFDILEEDAYDAEASGSMEQVADGMTETLRAGEHQVHFVHLDDVDGAGHAAGFVAGNPGYLEAIERVDGHLGEFLDAILDRPKIATEEWLILFSADHGGTSGGSHGCQTSDCQTIPLVAAGASVEVGEIPAGEASHLDIHPTVLEFVGLNPTDFVLDGVAIGTPRESDCDDGIDEDGDGLFDCEDPDCDDDPVCWECDGTELGDSIGQHLYSGPSGTTGQLVGSCGGAGDELLFEWSAPAAGRYAFDAMGSGFDTTLYAFDTTCTGPELACNDDLPSVYRSGFALDLAEADDLLLVLDSFDAGGGGNAALSIYPFSGSCPDGDLGSSAGDTSGDLVFAPTAHLQGCPPAVGNQTFTWTAPSAGTWTFDTEGSTFDTVLYVLDACGGTELACNDDSSGVQSEVEVTLGAGDTVVVGIGGFNGSEGAWTITVSE